MDEERGALIATLLLATWPDGGHDGFPTRRVAERLADALLSSDWLAIHDAEAVRERDEARAEWARLLGLADHWRSRASRTEDRLDALHLTRFGQQMPAAFELLADRIDAIVADERVGGAAQMPQEGPWRPLGRLKPPQALPHTSGSSRAADGHTGTNETHGTGE